MSFKKILRLENYNSGKYMIGISIKLIKFWTRMIRDVQISYPYNMFNKNKIIMTNGMSNSLLRRFNKYDNQTITQEEFFDGQFIMPNSGSLIDNQEY